MPAAIARAYHTAMQRPCGPTFVSIPEDDWDAETERDRAPPRRRRVRRRRRGAAGRRRRAARQLASRPRRRSRRRPRRRVGRHGRAGRAVRRAGVGEPAVEPVQLPRGSSGVRRVPHPAAAPRSPGSSPTTTSSSCSAPLSSPTTCTPAARSSPRAPRCTSSSTIRRPRPWRRSGPRCSRRCGPAFARLLDHLGPERRTPAAAGRGPRTVPPASEPISPAFVMHTVARLMPPDAVIVEEAPSHRNAMHDHLPIRTQRRLLLRGQRRTRLRPAGRGRCRPRRPDAAGDLPARRRFEPLLDPGAVDGRAARPADRLRDPQQPGLRSAQGAGAGDVGRQAARRRPAGHRVHRPRRRLRVCGPDGLARRRARRGAQLGAGAPRGRR